MLIPRKPPKGFRKPHHPRRTGAAKGGTRVVFGEYGIQALEPAHPSWWKGLDHRLPGSGDHEEAGRDPDGFR